MAAYKDYYDTLGLSRSADQKEIRSAYRKLAAKYHPDRNPDDPSAEERFKEVNEAYTVLNDPEKRKFYDRYGSAEGRPNFSGGAGGGFGGGFGGPPPGGAAEGDFSDFFQSLFGGGFAGAGGQSFFTGTGAAGSRGQDPFSSIRQERTPRRVDADISVPLEEAYRGDSKVVSVDGRRLEVTLPKGAKDGAKLRLRAQAPGGGDLYLTVKLEDHPVFRLEGDNVRVIVDVPDYVAALGGKVRVPTLDGDVEMNLPAGTQSGRSFRLRERGWPKKDGSRGDELAEIRATIPEALSEAQIKLYEELRELNEAGAKAA